MRRHTFDPISAALGLLAIAFGILVATDATRHFHSSGGWWLAGAAAIVGLAIVPRPGKRPSEGTHRDTLEPDVAAEEPHPI